MKKNFRVIQGSATQEQQEQEQALTVLNWILYGKALDEGDEAKAEKHLAIAKELGIRRMPLDRNKLRVIDGKKS